MASQLGALILAAGASRRMGTPKALLPWAGTTLLEHAVQQARATGVEHIVVVLGPATKDLQLPEVHISFNPDPETGRSASICIGSQALPDDLDALVVQSVDQPCESALLTCLFAALESNHADIALPTYGGRRGHPVCLSGRLLPEVRTVNEEDQGLRSIVRRHTVIEVPVSTPAVEWNFNERAAYAAARAAERL